MDISSLLVTPLFWTMIFSVVFFSYLTISTLKNTAKPKAADNGRSLILSGILVFAVIIFLVWHKRDEIAWSLQEHKDLMTTQGKITTSEIFYQSKGWHFDIWYEYSIDGTLYKSDQVNYGYTGSSDKSFATSYVNKYSVGKSVIVYYDPIAHEKSVLEPDVFNYDWIFVTILAAPLGIFFIANGLAQRMRQTKSRYLIERD